MDAMITGDLIKCRDTGSLGVVTKLISNPVHDSHISQFYQVLWLEDAVMTFSSPVDIEKIPFNPDDTLDSDYSVTTL